MRYFGLLVVVLLSIGFAQAQSKPSKIAVAEALGDTLLNRENFVGAIKQYNKVAKATKLKTAENRRILYKRALCYFYLSEYDKALADLDIFIDENQNLPRAKILRAFIFRELGENERQLADLNDVLDADQFNIDLLKWRAGLLVEMEMHREAVSELKKIKLWGTDEEVELYLGMSYYGLNEPDSAITHFDAAIALNGGFLPAYMYAGMLSLEQQAFPLALTYLNLALMLEPNNLQLKFYKGIALIETDKKDEGCSLLSKAFYGGIDEAGDYLKEYCYPSEN